jgi:phosphate starvation-inducible protein PhoH
MFFQLTIKKEKRSMSNLSLLDNINYNNLSKRQKRLIRRLEGTGLNNIVNINDTVSLKKVFPKTSNQKIAWNLIESNYNVILHGVAGTGKTFLSFYLALEKILSNEYEKITLVRSVVPTREIGFLPGSERKKTEVFEAPFKAIATELTGREDFYDDMKDKGMINFITTSFIRGITLNNTIVIVDEAQNMNFHELDSIITRIGENCQFIACGDFRQTDKSGILDFIKICKEIDNFDLVEFDEDDIVRSKFVKDYILSKLKHGYN